MIVRPATTEDVREAAEIVATVAQEGMLGAQAPVDLDDRMRTLGGIVQDSGPSVLWVLEDEQQVVGMASMQQRFGGVLSLGMALLPEARGRGGGRMLVEQAIEHAREVGAHKIDLEVWPDNGRAIALYAKMGFEVEGLRRKHCRRRDGSLRSSLVMSRLFADARDEPVS